VRPAAALFASAVLAGCQTLTSGLAKPPAPTDAGDAPAPDLAEGGGWEATPVVLDAGEPPGLPGAPELVGCSDGTREGFRDLGAWPDIAGCAGAFDQPGVVGLTAPACGRRAGDTGVAPAGRGCSAADLCAEHWHLCRDAADVASRSPAGGCEGCVPAGEPRFFLVAAGASAMGVCSPDPEAANDLHGCGWLGRPESEACAPLLRRLGFADCRATDGVWSCGDTSDHLREAALVTKPGPGLGGALCCRD